MKENPLRESPLCSPGDARAANLHNRKVLHCSVRFERTNVQQWAEFESFVKEDNQLPISVIDSVKPAKASGRETKAQISLIRWQRSNRSSEGVVEIIVEPRRSVRPENLWVHVDRRSS